jgi:hypothetical protein
MKGGAERYLDLNTDPFLLSQQGNRRCNARPRHGSDTGALPSIPVIPYCRVLGQEKLTRTTNWRWDQKQPRMAIECPKWCVSLPLLSLMSLTLRLERHECEVLSKSTLISLFCSHNTEFDLPLYLSLNPYSPLLPLPLHPPIDPSSSATKAVAPKRP